MHHAARAVAAAGLAVALVAGAQAATGTVTPWQAKTRFAKVTGQKLKVNRPASSAGHYVALDVGPPSIATRGRFGTFTVFVVTGPDVAAEVEALLVDAHTGKLGRPTRAGIHWEAGTTIHGDAFWLAKRRYGRNIVVWWIGNTPVRTTDATWARLHRALAAVVRGSRAPTRPS